MYSKSRTQDFGSRHAAIKQFALNKIIVTAM